MPAGYSSREEWRDTTTRGNVAPCPCSGVWCAGDAAEGLEHLTGKKVTLTPTAA